MYDWQQGRPFSYVARGTGLNTEYTQSGNAAFWRTFHHDGKISPGGCGWAPFTTVTITYKVAVYAPAEWADTLTLFHLYQYMYSVGLKHASMRNLGWGGGVNHIGRQKGPWIFLYTVRYIYHFSMLSIHSLPPLSPGPTINTPH